MPAGITRGGLTVKLAGQDISSYVSEDSIKITDALAQGSGRSAGGTGRAKTGSVRVALGPAASAIGAGQPIVGGPKLVRQGEVKIYDSTATCIFGGYATTLKDATEKTVNYTDIEFHDYWQDLDRTTVNEVYDAQTDIFVIRDLMAKYAPSVSLTYIPTTGYYNLGVKPYRNKTLKQALQNIADITGYAIWIDANKALHYVQPTQAAAAPFSLSDSPNFLTSFQCNVTEFNVDDTAAINRVTFYGGKRLSNDFTQDISNQATGTNKIFTLAYYPHHAADGKFHVTVNNVEQVLGFDGGTGANNTLKSQGGNADVLLNVDAHVVTFDVAPAAGASVKAKYRYESPLIVQLVDNNSVGFYGRYLDGTIVDTSVFDLPIAVQRCRILLLEQSMGLQSLKISCWKAGITTGQLLTVNHGVRGIHNAFLVQQVDIVPLGAGNFQYDIQCGAWNWNLVDLVMKTAQDATPDDNSATESTSIAQVQTDSEKIKATFTVTTRTTASGQYYARATAVGDGHDAYPGFATI